MEHIQLVRYWLFSEAILIRDYNPQEAIKRSVLATTLTNRVLILVVFVLYLVNKVAVLHTLFTVTPGAYVLIKLLLLVIYAVLIIEAQVS